MSKYKILTHFLILQVLSGGYLLRPLTAYTFGQSEGTQKVTPKHLHCHLVADCSIGHAYYLEAKTLDDAKVLREVMSLVATNTCLHLLVVGNLHCAEDP